MSNTRLQALLNAQITTTKQGFPPPLYAGSFALVDNVDLAQIILDQYAVQVAEFPNYADFKQCFRESRFDEKEPKLTDPQFQIRDPKLNRKEQKIKSVYFYLKAKEKYDQRNHDHEAARARSRAIASRHHADIGGYVSFVRDASFASGRAHLPKSLLENERFFFNANHRFFIDETQREKHTYLTASSGHGKSVTLETLFYHYLTNNTETAVILLDPHGDLATSCARLLPNEKSGRLVYIKPSLNRKITPTLNPFDLKSTEWDDINKASDSLIEVFREVMRADGEGANFTPQMVTLLKPCISALLHRKGSTFVDLMRFLDDDPADHEVWLNYARRVLSNPMHLDALNKDFMKDSFNPSKLSIKTKIRNLLNDDYFFNFLVGKSTIDLQTEIDRNAVIVFDLSGLTDKAKDAIGRFIMANITTLAKSRANLPYSKRTPIHLFVDECQNFVSESMKTILTETRKFRLHGTFAQQFTGQGMNAEMKKAIIGNSAVKITGNNGLTDLKIMAAEMGTATNEMQKLRRGEFFMKSGASPAVRVRVPMVEKNARMNAEQWAEVKTNQISRYYRLIKPAEDNKPEHTQRTPPQTDAKVTHYERTPSGLKENSSGIKPHLEPRGGSLINPFD